MAVRLNWAVRVPLLFCMTVRNWRPFFGSGTNAGDITYELRNGMTLTVPPGTTNANPFIDIWLNHVYDHSSICWKTATMIVDVGGHMGAFALYAAKKSPTANIFTYEPDPVTFSYLQKNIGDNKLGERVKCRSLAVGGATGEAVLHVLPGRSEANSLYASLPGSHEVKVAVTTLKNIFDEEHITHCELLKMNAEGVEYEILYGLPVEYLKRIDCIVMNYHLFVKKPRATPKELRTYLESHGFTVTEQGKRIFVAVKR